MSDTQLLIAFKNGQQIAYGLRHEVEPKVRALAAGDAAALVVLDAETSAPVDIALQDFSPRAGNRALPRRVGRPKLGVTSKEVSLLPRHWDWLAEQPGGASATLRRLVEQARRGAASRDEKRRSTESIDRFMRVMAGDLPHYEAASRAFYQDRRDELSRLIVDWPQDIRDHLNRLLAHHWGG